MRRAALVALASGARLGAVAAPATAQDVLLSSDEPIRALEQVQGRFRTEGAITVTFRGDGVEGVVTHRPVPRGSAFANVLSTRRGRLRSLDLFSDGAEGGTTAARVTRTAPDGTRRRCTDARAERFASLSAGPSRTLVLELPSAGALRTRCGGPTAADIGAAGVRLAASTLAPGSRTVDLRAERPFSAGGLSGTVRSTVALRLEDLQRRPMRSARQRRGSTTRAVRLAVERVEGAVRLDLVVPAGAPECEELDQCGLVGTQTLEPSPAGARAELLRRGRRTFGFVALGSGTSRTSVRRPDGSSCADVAPAPPMAVEFATRGGRVRATLFPLCFEALAQTRCPAPALADLGAPRRFASGTVSRSALARRSFTIRLRARDAFGGGLARGRTRGDVVLTLRRTGG